MPEKDTKKADETPEVPKKDGEKKEDSTEDLVRAENGADLLKS